MLKSKWLLVLEEVGEKVLMALFFTFDFLKDKLYLPPLRAYRKLWLYLKFDFKVGAIYLNPPTGEVIQIASFGNDFYGGDVCIAFTVLRAGRVNRTYTVYEWDDFVANFWQMKKLNDIEELLYGQQDKT